MREYKTKKFTVRVESREGFDDQPAQTLDGETFKTVRIYANVWSVDFLAGSILLLGCDSGFKPKSFLMKSAMQQVERQLSIYKEHAQAIVDF